MRLLALDGGTVFSTISPRPSFPSLVIGSTVLRGDQIGRHERMLDKRDALPGRRVSAGWRRPWLVVDDVRH